MIAARWINLVSALLLGGAVPAAALGDQIADETDQNRQLLEQLKTDPAHLAKLRRDWAAFRGLPPERQGRLRQLDRDLHGDDTGKQARLRRVLDRYNEWLKQLPESDRQRIDSAKDPKERLHIVREIRERQWVERLPRTLREQVQNAPPQDRPALIARLKQEERSRREDWLIAVRHWDRLMKKEPLPTRLTDLSADAQEFVMGWLQPLLSKDEVERLKKAEGQWPLFPRTLVELADKHPFRLPGPNKGPIRLKELPGDFQASLEPKLGAAERARLNQAEGRWPEFAIVVTDIARQKNVSCPAFGPAAPEDFPQRVQKVIQARLMNPKFGALDQREKQRLKAAEKNWPLYPRTLFELATKHNVRLGPEFALVTLPGPRQTWENYRLRPLAAVDRLPDPPERLLREFALKELKDVDPANIEGLLTHPLAREGLKQEFFKKHPEMLERLRRGEKPGRKAEKSE